MFSIFLKVFLLSVFILFNSLYADIMDVNGNLVNLDHRVEILEDKNSKLSIDSVSSQLYVDKFNYTDSKGINFGYASSSYWLRFTLQNSSNQEIHRYLEADQVLLSHIELYTPSDGGVFSKKFTGVMYIPENSSFRNHVFHIVLPANSTQTYYMKANSSTSEMGFALNLYSEEALYEKEKNEQIYLAYLFGAFFIMLIYNSFVFLSTRDKNYLYYCLYLFTIIIQQMDYFGYGRQYIWTNFPFFSSYGGVFIAGMTIVTVLLFTRSFLHTKENLPKADKLLQGMILVGFILGVILTVPRWHNLEFIVHYFFLSGVILISIGTYLLVKGNRQAKFYMAGWFLLVSGLTVVYLKIIGVLPINTITTWAGSIGILAEMALLSFGLADKIKQAQLEKEEVTKKLIQEKEKHHERLEKTVRERTEELNVALEEKNMLFKELQHRVKNNMQVIISLLDMQEQRDNDPQFKQKLHAVQNRVKAISIVHEKLDLKGDLKNIDSHTYCLDIAKNIIYSYADIEDNIELEVDNKDVLLDIDTSISCGIIVNELVTNSMKYAFKDTQKNKKIYISIKNENNKYRLMVQDNGENSYSTDDKQGLGLKLVTSIVKSKLKGEIIVDRSNGTKYEIIF